MRDKHLIVRSWEKISEGGSHHTPRRRLIVLLSHFYILVQFQFERTDVRMNCARAPDTRVPLNGRNDCFTSLPNHEHDQCKFLTIASDRTVFGEVLEKSVNVLSFAQIRLRWLYQKIFFYWGTKTTWDSRTRTRRGRPICLDRFPNKGNQISLIATITIPKYRVGVILDNFCRFIATSLNDCQNLPSIRLPRKVLFCRFNEEVGNLHHLIARNWNMRVE